ncbi:hypothetical protein, partial [Microbacterium sp. NPDC087868]
MGKEALRRVFATIAVIAVVFLGAFGISQALEGPADRDLGEGFIFEEVTPSPTIGTPGTPSS